MLLLMIGFFFLLFFPYHVALPMRGIAMDAKQVHSTIETCGFVLYVLFGVWAHGKQQINNLNNYSRFYDLKWIHQQSYDIYRSTNFIPNTNIFFPSFLFLPFYGHFFSSSIVIHCLLCTPIQFGCSFPWYVMNFDRLMQIFIYFITHKKNNMISSFRQVGAIQISMIQYIFSLINRIIFEWQSVDVDS